MKKTLLALAIGVASMPVAMAADYPPYPDVWGRELVAPPARIVAGYYLRDRGNGDFLITYTHHAADPETGNLQGGGDWRRLDFFAGDGAVIDEAEQGRIRLLYGLPRIRIQSQSSLWLYLPNEMQVKPLSRELRGIGCWLNYAGSLVLRDRAEKVVASKVVLRVLDAPERREYWDSCEPNQDRTHYQARVDGLSFVLYGLKDGTFLAEGSGSPFAIRFRPDLTSPYIDAHPNLFLVDSEEVDRVVRAAYAKLPPGGSRIQAGNDALYDYALGLRRAKLAAKGTPAK